MGIRQSKVAEDQKSQRETILVVGGCGRTGQHLVRRLCDDQTHAFHVAVLARDPAKAARLRESSWKNCDVTVVEGDLGNVAAWESQLSALNVSQIATAVSCGVRTFSNPLGVLLPTSVHHQLSQAGFELSPPPQNLPRLIDNEGMEALCAAAKAHGVKRMVCVTTASTGTPYSIAGVFLNIVAAMSVKHKFLGEQAVRRSGIDYVIIRPFGLQDTTPLGGDTGLGINWTQGRTEGTRKRIPRADVAAICHEALARPHGARSNGGTLRTTFECWATPDHARRLPWGKLRQESPGSVADVNHDIAVAAGVGLAGAACFGLGKGAMTLSRRIARFR